MSEKEKPTKDTKRAEAREKARLQREADARAKKRKRFLIQGFSLLGVLAVGALITTIIVTTSNAPQGNQLNPKNLASDGVVVSKDFKVTPTPAIEKNGKVVPTVPSATKVNIVAYVDYLCPFCKQFETANNTQLEQWLNNDQVTVEYHPIAILSEYSARASNAAACVIDNDPDKFWAYNKLLYGNQPAENVAGGLKNDTLVKLAVSAGVKKSEIQNCVNKQNFSNWVKNETERATNKAIPNSNLKKITGTPTVLVDGELYQGNPADAASFKAFVEKAIAAKSN